MRKSTKLKKAFKRQLWNEKKRQFKNSAGESVISLSGDERRFYNWIGVDYENTPKEALSQTTYYTCLKMLSETMGKMPLKEYQRTNNGLEQRITPTLRLLTTNPNPYMTSTTFWTWNEYCCQHYGNAYVWIDSTLSEFKIGGSYKINAFYPMEPYNVQVMRDRKGLFGTRNCLYYLYSNPYTGEQRLFPSDQVLHFKTWFTKNGYEGLAVRDILKETIDGASYAEAYESGLYRDGMTAKMALQYGGSLDDERIKEVQKKFADKLSGSQAAGKVIAIPAAFNLVPLNQSMVDADFADLRKYSALQIAAAMGVKNSALNNYESSKYASVETENMAFLDTFGYRLKMYEDELNSKLLTPMEYEQGYYFKFNVDALLRTDAKTRYENMKTGIDGGFIMPNEARDKIDLPHAEGGDRLYINGSYIPLTEAGAAYKTSTDGGKTNENSRD